MGVVLEVFTLTNGPRSGSGGRTPRLGLLGKKVGASVFAEAFASRIGTQTQIQSLTEHRMAPNAMKSDGKSNGLPLGPGVEGFSPTTTGPEIRRLARQTSYGVQFASCASLHAKSNKIQSRDEPLV